MPSGKWPKPQCPRVAHEIVQGEGPGVLRMDHLTNQMDRVLMAMGIGVHGETPPGVGCLHILVKSRGEFGLPGLRRLLVVADGARMRGWMSSFHGYRVLLGNMCTASCPLALGQIMSG